jgi:hypothetical protein
MSVGKVLAESGFFQDSRGAAQAVAKILAGAELGFGPVASMTGVNIIKGRVTLSANLMAAAIKRHPHYTYRLREHSAERCVIDFIESGEIVGESSFSMDDAKQAGLASSENYRKYPKNMLFSRAISNGAKWFCPDVFGGAPVYSPDELGAEVDGETGEVVSIPDADVVDGAVSSSVSVSKPSSDDQPYVGDDDHAAPYIDRGGRDTRPQRPELKEAASGLKWAAIKDSYVVAGLTPPERAKDAFREDFDKEQLAALDAALRNRRLADLMPTDAPYAVAEITPMPFDDSEDDLPWGKNAEVAAAHGDPSEVVDEELPAADIAEARKRLEAE